MGVMTTKNTSDEVEGMAMRIGIIGGSGLGEAVGSEKGEVVEIDTPFGKTSSPIVLTKWQGVEVAILQRHGIGHLLNPSQVPYRANLFAMKKLGVTHVVASGATGSLREEIRPGDLVVVDQVIDKTHKRANTFYEGAAVHVEMGEPFCGVMRKWLLAAAARMNHTRRVAGDEPVRVHEKGTYVCMEGPAFSTKAESHMHRSWGGDLIGMTAMPEARLAREAELPYALIGLPTDYDCWRAHEEGMAPQDLLMEIIGNLKRASGAGVALIQEALADVSVLEGNVSAAASALKLGIWSDKTKIDAKEVKRLEVLWGKYFE